MVRCWSSVRPVLSGSNRSLVLRVRFLSNSLPPLSHSTESSECVKSRTNGTTQSFQEFITGPRQDQVQTVSDQWLNSTIPCRLTPSRHQSPHIASVLVCPF